MNQVTATLANPESATELFEELAELGLSPKLDPSNAFIVIWSEFEESIQEFQDLLDYILGFNPVSLEQVFCSADHTGLSAGGYLWQDNAVYEYRVKAEEARSLIGRVRPLDEIHRMIDKVDHAVEDHLMAYSE